jgi:hypothetical protein
MFDEDFDAAAVTGKRVLAEASRRRVTVIPAHYPGTAGCPWSPAAMRSWSTAGSK